MALLPRTASAGLPVAGETAGETGRLCTICDAARELCASALALRQ